MHDYPSNFVRQDTDTVTLSDDLVITGQGVGVASRSSGFDGVDGILGIGPTVLTGEFYSFLPRVRIS